MSKASPSLTSLPQEAGSALQSLGADLALARLRRRESLRTWAARLGVSVPTLMKLERGDPGVSAGIYATALWMMGRSAALSTLAAPQTDLGALEADIRAARARKAADGGKPRQPARTQAS